MSMDPSAAYRHAAGHSASPVRLVIMLYEQLVKDLRRASAAMEKNEIEIRTQEIAHALLVVGRLQGTLDMQRGGEVASSLDRFYSVLRTNLLVAQVRASREVLGNLITQLLTLRHAWEEVDRAGLGNETSSARSMPLDHGGNDSRIEPSENVEWRG